MRRRDRRWRSGSARRRGTAARPSRRRARGNSRRCGRRVRTGPTRASAAAISGASVRPSALVRDMREPRRGRRPARVRTVRSPRPRRGGRAPCREHASSSQPCAILIARRQNSRFRRGVDKRRALHFRPKSCILRITDKPRRPCQGQTAREKGAATSGAAARRRGRLGREVVDVRGRRRRRARGMAGRARFRRGVRGPGAGRRAARRRRHLGPPQGREAAVRRQHRLRQHDPARATSRRIPATASWK